MESLCAEMTADGAKLVGSYTNIVQWITEKNRLRDFTINLRPGSVTEQPVSSQPSEPILELIAGAGTYGRWLALGASGAVYAEGMGGFEQPVADLSPALALRYSGNPPTLAARKPDGTWQAFGQDTELIQFVGGIGPALDLDISTYGKQHKIVLWIEPDTKLRPMGASPGPTGAPPKEAGKSGRETPSHSLVGTWKKANTGTDFEFRSDGTISVPLAHDSRYHSGKWALRRDTVTLTFPDDEKKLVLSGDRLIGGGWELQKVK